MHCPEASYLSWSLRRDDAYSDENTTVCTDCYEEHYTRCSCCDALLYEDEAYYSNGDAYCRDCYEDASQLCGDPLTAKRSIKAKNEVVSNATMLPHRSGHPNRKIILYAMYRSNPILAQIKPIQQRIKSFSLIWSLHQSASTYRRLVRCSEETTRSSNVVSPIVIGTFTG